MRNAELGMRNETRVMHVAGTEGQDEGICPADHTVD